MLTASAFLLTYSLACILALARHPIFGLLAYLASFYFHPPSRWWSYILPDLRWSLIAAGVTAVALVIHRQKLPSRPIFSNRMMLGLMLFIVWVAVQTLWALNVSWQINLLDHYVKFAIAAVLIYKCIDNESHLKMFLWAHVIGSFAFGLNAFLNYSGGRFEAYGGPGFADANYAGLHAVTGIFAASILMLAGNLRERLSIAFLAPFIINALVATMSRSSFLALFCGGLAFLWYCPPRFRTAVSVLGAIALAGFLSLAHEEFWERIETIKFMGQEVEAVDTGIGRMVLWEAQLEMSARYPLGCGHRCTATLSPDYLDDRFLTTGPGGNRARASHNTYLTLLVEQGVVGVAFFLAYLFWLYRSASTLHSRLRDSDGFLARALPGVVAILLSISVADVFVDYLKLEVRIWYIAVTLAILHMCSSSSSPSLQHSKSESDSMAGNPAPR